jgi:methionyl-tRNA synthetase
MSHFFITTAIDYTNGAPHLGHAYEKVLADVLARYHRLKGDPVFFLTGVDQHGQKVQQSADKEGVAPQQFVDGVTKKFVNLWDKLDVRFDEWAATTDVRHKNCVRAILQRLWDEHDPATGQSRWIYKKSQRGFYSVRQEQFLTDKERGDDGQFGPEWGVVEERDEENYYFRLAAHRQWLLDLIDSRSAAGRPLVIPDFRVGELRNAVEKLEGDLCISRPRARLTWGIPFPFDEAFVTYVWFDALVNYISFAPGFDLDFDEATQRRKAEESPADAHLSASLHFRDWWPPLHVIGKDILIPAHGVYWPIMLKSIGFSDDEIPTLLVHGWWNISGAKMSKSEGNVIDPDVLADKYGAETLRYYLMSDIATGKDADFSEERLIQRYNSDLANSLGNLLNRTLSMAAKYREGVIVAPAGSRKTLAELDCGEAAAETGQPGSPKDRVRHRAVTIRGVWQAYADEMGNHSVAQGLAAALSISASCNELIDLTAPWKLAKDPADADDLDAVLYHLAESLRIIAILLYPVMPKAAHGIFDQLGWKLAESGRSQRFHLDDAKWGGLPDGHLLGKPTPLFPRIELPKAE